MNDIAIRVENLSKQFHIGALKKNRNIREALIDGLKAPFRRATALLQGQATGAAELDETIWALKDMSFEIRRGEVVGIIGGNGAGKSTLLKIISRISEPTGGFVEIHGRISSLLEVGTGFHPELTGRENVYLSAAILGMKRAEIPKKFNEIMRFAEIEKFIDTPVKHYSSGMYLRLAFAVAAHLETDVLLVDEILAVGDVQFQKKCMGKMQSVANEKRTVIFVSHSMSSVNRLCSRVLWLEGGRIRLDGKTEDVISQYLYSQTQSCESEAIISEETPVNGFQMKYVRIMSDKDESSYLVDCSRSFKIEIGYDVLEPIRTISIVHRITDIQGNVICTSWDTDTTDWLERVRESGQYSSICTIPPHLLRPGRYFLSVGALSETQLFASHENVLSFEVSAANYSLNTGRIGIITPLFKWEVKQSEKTIAC